MKKYPILQSGFTSMQNDGLTQGTFIKDPFVDFAIDKDHLKPKNLYFYNDDVSKLYQEWSADSTLLRKFEFRERLLLAAIQSFGTNSFYDWVQLQSKPETTGNLHLQFLLETLDFIARGERQLNVVQWLSLLNADVKTRSVNFEFDKYFDQSKHNKTIFGNAGMVYILQEWTSRVDGFQDLLISLQVIFGSRPYITDVADRNVGE